MDWEVSIWFIARYPRPILPINILSLLLRHHDAGDAVKALNNVLVVCLCVRVCRLIERSHQRLDPLPCSCRFSSVIDAER